MKSYLFAADFITSFLKANIKTVEKESIERIISMILSSKRVFIVGMGRSRLVGEAFAMRLMHLEVPVFIVGETTTPAIEQGDLLLAISGSGRTSHVLSVIEKAKSLGVKSALITSFEDSPAAKLADSIVKLEGKEKRANWIDYTENQLEGKYESLAPMGTLFEASTLIFLDCLIAEIASRLGKTEEELKRKHANLE